MTYGKVQSTPTFRRSHPYPGALQHMSDEDNKTEGVDFWNVVSNVKKYFVSSASDIVKKLTNTCKKTWTSDTGFSPLSSNWSKYHEGQFQSEQIIRTPSWMTTMMKDPNVSENVKQVSMRMLEKESRERWKYYDRIPGSERMDRRYIKAHDPTTSRILESHVNRLSHALTLSRPDPRRLAFGEVDPYSYNVISTPCRQRSKQTQTVRSEIRSFSQNNQQQHVSYRRPWSSVSRRSMSTTKHPLKECKDISCFSGKIERRSTGQQTISPMCPRKIFSWENSKRNAVSDLAEKQMSKKLTDVNVKQTINKKKYVGTLIEKEDTLSLSKTMQSPLKRVTKKTYERIGTQKEDSFSSNNTMKPTLWSDNVRRNLSDKMNSSLKKRKTFSCEIVEPTVKRKRLIEAKEEKSMDFNSSKIVIQTDDVDESVEVSQPEGESDTLISLSTQTCSKPTEIFKVEPEDEVQSFSDWDTKSDMVNLEVLTQTPISVEVGDSNSQNTIIETPVRNSALGPKAPPALFTASTIGENVGAGALFHPDQAISSVFSSFNKTQQSDSIIRVLSEEPDGEKEKNKPGSASEENENLVKTSTVQSSHIDDENVSYACRMAKMKRIKIRDHYIQKIDDLYEKHCMANDKEARKAKAVTMLREKYHKLQQDHFFYERLCKQYNIKPEEEYKGVDIVSTEEDEIIEKQSVQVPTPVGSKPTLTINSAPYRNPFDIDTLKTIKNVQPARFDFTKCSFAKPPVAAISESTEKSNGACLFSIGAISNSKAKISSTNSLFTVKDNALENKPKHTNPFRTSLFVTGVPKSTLFSSENNKVTGSKSLFSSNTDFSASEVKNNSLFTINSNNRKSAAENPFDSPKPLDTSMMDSEAPTESDSGSFTGLFGTSAPQKNIFGNSNTNASSTNSTNPFASTSVSSNPFSSVLSNSQFGVEHVKQSSNPFSSAGSGAAFGVGGSNGIFSTNLGPSGFKSGGNVMSGAKFSLGNLSHTTNRKRRPIVRGRRTLK